MDELRDDRADPRRLGNLLRRRRAQDVHRAKLLREAARGHKADSLESQGGEHDSERALARGLDGRDQVARRDLAEALELHQLLGRQAVEVRGRAHQLGALELGDLLFAEAVDVDRPVLEQLPAASGAVAIGALREHALALDGRGVADRAALGRLGHRCAIRALGLVWRGRQDLWDDVAGAQHDDLVAGAHVLAREVLLVVQRRELDCHTGDMDRLEEGEGVQIAELSGVPLDVLERRDSGGRREFPRDGGPRLAADHAEAPLELVVIDLHDHAVDLEVQRAAALLPGQALGHDVLLAAQQLNIGIDAEAVLAKPGEHLPMGGELDPLGRPDPVGPHRQRPCGGQRRIELADRARGGVAGVHEGRLTRLRSALAEQATLDTSW